MSRPKYLPMPVVLDDVAESVCGADAATGFYATTQLIESVRRAQYSGPEIFHRDIRVAGDD
jgi:hypothetical protein